MKNEVQLSAQFKKQTTRAIFSIIFFVITYILLLAFALGLTAVCVTLGIVLITNMPRLITIVLGVGLIVVGLLVLGFILKFLFKSHKTDQSHLVEITEKDEPKLFALINNLVTKIDTDPPKKVFLSAEVNASVFYDSSFWSMFFPVQKNLLIGMGLVNSVTESELEAILAHEFGHFSQKTMKVGSYVYNVNQIIHNMLYDNDSFGNIVHQISSVSDWLGGFASLAVGIISGIQWLLAQVYGVVNKSYMALSREMEFHADEIAASVTGYEPLKSSLMRLSFAAATYDSVLGYYNSNYQNNIKSQNIYPNHNFALSFYANNHQLTFENNLPKINLLDLNRFNKSKLVIENQWASHPSTEDRVAHLEQTGFTATELKNKPANNLFTNIEATQKQLTSKLFEGVEYKEEPSNISENDFAIDFEKRFKDNGFPDVYNEYYDIKNIAVFDLSAANIEDSNATVAELFSDEMVSKTYELEALTNDLAILRQIEFKELKLKTFDYDGKKYKRKEAESLVPKVKQNIANTEEVLKQNDKRIYEFFTKLEKSQKTESKLKQLYEKYFDIDTNYESKIRPVQLLNDSLDFINYTTEYDTIEHKFIRIKKLETEVKELIKTEFTEQHYQKAITPDIKENFDSYVNNNLTYFNKNEYNTDNLNILFEAINNYVVVCSKGFFEYRKTVLEYQASLL